MSLKIRFRFDGRCTRHPRYDPKRDGRPSDGNCEGCESLYVIHLYVKVATRRAENANLIVVRASADHESDREEQQAIDVKPTSETGAESLTPYRQFRFFLRAAWSRRRAHLPCWNRPANHPWNSCRDIFAATGEISIRKTRLKTN